MVVIIMPIYSVFVIFDYGLRTTNIGLLRRDNISLVRTNPLDEKQQFAGILGGTDDSLGIQMSIEASRFIVAITAARMFLGGLVLVVLLFLLAILFELFAQILGEVFSFLGGGDDFVHRNVNGELAPGLDLDPSHEGFRFRLFFLALFFF